MFSTIIKQAKALTHQQEQEYIEKQDDKLRVFCIENFGTPYLTDCNECPHAKKCDDFIERHNGLTPLQG